MSEKIYIPIEIFKKLPVEEADKLQEELMYIYFRDNPGELRNIMERAEGDTDLIKVYKEDEFNKIMSKDYAYDINIIRNRKNDEIAEKLVETINIYNNKVPEEEIME